MTGAGLLVGGLVTGWAVSAETGNLALAGPVFMGWSFLGPISGIDVVLVYSIQK